MPLKSVPEAEPSSNHHQGKTLQVESNILLDVTPKAARAKHIAKQAAGTLAALLSGAFMCQIAVPIKLLKHVDPAEILVFRYLVQSVFHLGVAVYTKETAICARGEQKFIIMTAILEGIAACLTYYAFNWTALPDVSAIVLSSSVMATLFSRSSAKIEQHTFQILSVAMVISGILIIAAPIISSWVNGKDCLMDENIKGLIGAVSACLVTAISIILSNNIQNTSKILQSLHSAAIALFIALLVMFIRNAWEVPSTGDIYLIVLNALGGVLSYSCWIAALKVHDVAPASILKSLCLALAFTFQKTVIRDNPQWTSILGVIMIWISVTATTVRKWQETSQKTPYTSCASGTLTQSLEAHQAYNKGFQNGKMFESNDEKCHDQDGYEERVALTSSSDCRNV